MVDVAWLLHDAVAAPATANERATVDDPNWRASIERIQISETLKVFLTQVQAHRDITVEARDYRTDQWIASQVTIAGRADLDFLDGQRTHVSPEQSILFRPSNRVAAFSLAAGATFHSAGCGFNLDRVLNLFDGAVPSVLRELVKPQLRTSAFVPVRCAPSLRNVAKKLFAPGLNGPLRTMMMEGAAMQLFAAQLAAAGHAPLRSRRALSTRECEAIDEARELLLADMRCPPTLGELSAAVGLTEKRLNAGFRSRFGKTVFEMLRNERLEHARVAFESGEVLLKQIAFRVGYNHVTNFINAFTARYGAPPRRYSHDAGGRPRRHHSR